MDWYAEITKQVDVIKASPLILLLVAAIGWAVHALYVGERVDGLKQQNENYRRALGISAPYSGIYADLSNDDLKSKTVHAVSKLRHLHLGFQKRSSQAEADWRNKKMTDENYNNFTTSMDRQATEEFIKDLRSEAIALDSELRHRLSPQALSTIVGAGPILDPNITIQALVPGKFGVFFIETLANELEEMNNKLPADQRKWWVWPCLLIAIACCLLALFWAIHSGVRIVRIRGPQSRIP
jgi:hypothetical protein